MLDFCKAHNMLICNGRMGSDLNKGSLTCLKGNGSIIDYFLCSAKLLKNVIDFDVKKFDPMLSDVHCATELQLLFHGLDKNQCKYKSVPDSNVKYVWKNEEQNNYPKKMDLDKVKNVLEMLDKDVDIDVICSNIVNIFKDAADASGLVRNISLDKPKRKNKSWYNAECRNKRKVYCKARNHYMREKNELSKNDMKKACNEYKKEIRKAVKEEKKIIGDKIKRAKVNDPKLFWKMIGDRKRKQGDISLDEFRTHFENLNACTDDNDNIPDTHVDCDFDKDVAEDVLNSPITEDEIRRSISNLKNNKACGNDLILNEYIKASKDVLLPLWMKLFNNVLDSGKIPEDWQIGTIVPIYKGKGDVNNVDNYRGITLLSCIGKLFTSVLNNRLNVFCDLFNVIDENQAGFRKSYSTTDHIFLVKSLIDLFKFQKKRLFCAFVDYKKAFDVVWRAGLWQKLYYQGIQGKMLNLVKNMYDSIKSCVMDGKNGCVSEFFTSNVGLRQGENLSPLLFSLFINDLELFLCENDVKGITVKGIPRLTEFFKLFIILYADDTVIFAESAKHLQEGLNKLEEYCHMWKLNVNAEKTKVMCFGYNRKNDCYKFLYEDHELEIVSSYKYLGIIFESSGFFTKCRVNQKTQAEKAMFSLLRKCKKLDLSIDVQLELFDKTVVPVLLYGCEVWGYENLKQIEQLHVKFCKYIMLVKKNTPNSMVHGELGRYPLDITVKCRMLSFWTKLVNYSECNKYSSRMYNQLRIMFDNNILKTKWMMYIKGILDECGLSYVWNQNKINAKWLILQVKQTLKDIFVQQWLGQLDNSNKTLNYRMYKTEFRFEKYLIELPVELRVMLSKFRLGGMRLPVDRGRFQNIPRESRFCDFCDSEQLGDEFHMILECKSLVDLRKKYLPTFCLNSINMFKFSNVMNVTNNKQLINLSRFIKELNKLLK